MTWGVDACTARTRYVVGCIACAVVLALPSLLTPAAGTPASVTLAAVALALAGLIHLGSFSSLVRRSVPAATGTDDSETPVLSGRVTDRPHHPLRPRAPGRA